MRNNQYGSQGSECTNMPWLASPRPSVHTLCRWAQGLHCSRALDLHSHSYTCQLSHCFACAWPRAPLSWIQTCGLTPPSRRMAFDSTSPPHFCPVIAGLRLPLITFTGPDPGTTTKFLASPWRPASMPHTFLVTWALGRTWSPPPGLPQGLAWVLWDGALAGRAPRC